MKNKFTKGLCVLLVATLFVSTGVILKLYSKSEPGKDIATDEEIEDLLSENDAIEKKELSFTNAPEGYFNDALFIGDSRTVGLKMYAPIEGATYFASVGLDVYEIEETAVEVDGIGSITLTDLLKQNKYGKIYIMLGINELGFDYDTNLVKYKKLIDSIRTLQPDTIVFIEANLRVGPDKSNNDSIINNANINRFNEAISKFANNYDSVYIDVNPIFDDGYGNLNPEFTGDDVHLYANHYTDWVNWLNTVAVVDEDAVTETTDKESDKTEGKIDENKDNKIDDKKAS